MANGMVAPRSSRVDDPSIGDMALGTPSLIGLVRGNS